MKRALQIVFLVVIFVVMAYPLVWMISISLRTGEGVSLRYYSEVWRARPFDRYLFNSIVVVVIVLVGNIVVCSMAGYAFARHKIPGGRFLFILVISMIMLPKQVILVPLYILMQKLHLLDTYAALTLPFTADPFNIFLIRQFLVSIPTDCEDAARLEGAGELTVLFRIVMLRGVPKLNASMPLPTGVVPAMVSESTNRFVLKLKIPSNGEPSISPPSTLSVPPF